MLARKRSALALLLAAWMLAPWSVAADAATAIYYSKADNVYGWCGGYAYDRAHSCAYNECIKSGGKDCKLALECNGGWGAIAFAEEPALGMGAVCGVRDAYVARSQALAACMAAANTMCWTDLTFDEGSQVRPAENQQFDFSFFAQILLDIQHFEPGNIDGETGPATQAAIMKFERALGRQQTGNADDFLVRRLLDASSGPQNLVSILKTSLLDSPKRTDLHDVTFASSATPVPGLSFSEVLMQRPEDQRLLALATILASKGSPCTLPAKDAEPLPDAKNGVWNIGCKEGDYTLMLFGDFTMINTGKSTMMPDGNATQPPDQSSGSANIPRPKP